MKISIYFLKTLSLALAFMFYNNCWAKEPAPQEQKAKMSKAEKKVQKKAETFFSDYLAGKVKKI